MESVCFGGRDVLFLELSADEVKGSVSGVFFFLTWCLFTFSATSSNFSFAWGIFPSDVLMRTHRKTLIGYWFRIWIYFNATLQEDGK